MSHNLLKQFLFPRGGGTVRFNSSSSNNGKSIPFTQDEAWKLFIDSTKKYCDTAVKEGVSNLRVWLVSGVAVAGFAFVIKQIEEVKQEVKDVKRGMDARMDKLDAKMDKLDAKMDKLEMLVRDKK